LAGHNSLGIEMEVAWSTPESFTVNNYPCYEDGSNCVINAKYVDPSLRQDEIQARLMQDKKQNPTVHRNIRS
jgi:hypothetical protein